MKKELFDTIFDQEVVPIIQSICSNNPLIKENNLDECKEKIFQEYTLLNQKYKAEIFSKGSYNILDRHKVASCICGAFLKVSIFNKQELWDRIRATKEPVEAYFYYVNELIALLAALRFLGIYMVSEHKGNKDMQKDIVEKFPIAFETTKSKTGFWNSMLFNLSQVKNKMQIGLEHYDMYAYAMQFFMVESNFYIYLLAGKKSENKDKGD